jgi:hypothetical protein
MTPPRFDDLLCKQEVARYDTLVELLGVVHDRGGVCLIDRGSDRQLVQFPWAHGDFEIAVTNHVLVADQRTASRV